MKEEMQDKFVIDEYYSEVSGEKNDILSCNSIEFLEKLKAASEKLEVLNDDEFDFPIDTLAIIEKAEAIKDEKKLKREMILFGALSIILISLYSLCGLLFGAEVILISQSVIALLIPWTIVPFSILKSKGSEV